MKAKAHLLLVVIILFFASCDSDDALYNDSLDQNMECCGELGDIPSEPDEDEED